MAILQNKKPEVDLRRQYTLFYEAGLALALIIMLLITNITWEPPEIQVFEMPDQEIVKAEEIEQTKQIEKPPPPPRPPVPVEVPNDDIIEDESIDLDAELDLDAKIDLPPPPPPAEDDEEPDFIDIPEVMPNMKGGNAELYKHLEYPEMARKANIEGRVYIQFIVNERGQVENPVVVRSANPILDDAAIAALRKVTFVPGLQRGRPVKVRMTQQVVFQLTN